MNRALVNERDRGWWLATPLGLVAVGAAALVDPSGVLPLATALAGAGSLALLSASRLRTQAEQHTRDSEDELATLRAAVAIAGVGVWDWDLRTHRVEYSDACTTMLGYRTGDIESSLSAWGKLVHPGDLSRVREALDAHLDGRTDVYEMEVRLRAADGTWRWILDRGRVLEREADGSALRAVGVHIDITPRRRGAGAANQSPGTPVEVESPVGRLLLVDDEPAMLVLMEAMAQRAGFSVRGAPNARVALALLDADPDVDGVVTDHDMPGMNGVELAHELARRGIRVPVLLVSGSAPADLGPVRRRLPKPFRMDAFMASIRELVGLEPPAAT